jgi:uncharacterized SAM-binding protein YcdF (DUF218 family)
VFFWLKALARAFILPPGLPLLVTLIGALLIWRRWRFGWLVFALGLGSLWLLCTPIVADRLSELAEGYPPFDPAKPTDAQAVVILGGGGERLKAPEYGGPVAEPILLERLMLGAYLARRLALPVLVSGAPSEAISMPATLTRSFGVTPTWIEGRSRDTYENAQLSARILFPAGVKRVILVTTSTHEWRAAHEFMAAGFQVYPAPAGMLATRELGIFKLVPGPTALWRSNAAVYELIGEPMRRVQAALGIREKFDRKVTAAGPLPAVTDQPAGLPPQVPPSQVSPPRTQTLPSGATK